jgi:hypothetical protein
MTDAGRTTTVALLAVSALWTGALAATPYAVSHGPADARVGRAAGLLYAAGSLICHQRPDRSYHPWGAQSPVCARCFGIYLAAPFGVALALTASRRRRRSSRPTDDGRAMWRRIILLACVPTALTIAWEWTTGDMTPGLVRTWAGAALGGPVAAFIGAVALGDVR